LRGEIALTVARADDGTPHVAVRGDGATA
jgi:hypothetical protein